jgi:hypothetical protein
MARRNEMGRINKGIENLNFSKKDLSGGEYKSSIGTSKSQSIGTATESRPAGKKSATPLLTHKQIEERAKAIWKQKGCPSGEDEKNWLEAEAQLKKELASK